MENAITFIILTWNSEKYIKNCLESIFNLDKNVVEVIVVDNGSIDNTILIIENEFPKTILIKLDQNYGTTYSRNIGIKKSNNTNKFLCILDSDTIINQDAIDKLINYLNENESIFITAPVMYDIKGMKQISCKRFPNVKIKLCKALPIKFFNDIGSKLESYDFSENREIIEVDYAISACWMMKRKVFEKVGYLDELIFYAPEDVDYCARVWEAGGKVALITSSCIIHDTQRISKKKLISKINFLHIIGLIYYFFKHKYLFNSDKIRFKSKS